VGRILANPKAWPKLSGGIRACRTQRFPYSVVYREGQEAILILAVMHHRRNPVYWRDRLEKV
jgi:hypothetical protein